MMEVNLTPSEDQAVKKFLSIVNEIRLQHNAGPMSVRTALKFVMARKFDIHRALALYEAHEMTRFREKLCNFDPNEEPLKSELEIGKFTVLPVRDESGAAIAIFSAHKHIPSETNHQVTLQGIVCQMDVALEDIQTQRCGIVFIYNMTGSKYSNFDYELCQKILGLLKGAYPARLKKVLIVTAPLWFKAPFKILRLFVREKLRDRVFMLNLLQLPSHVPKSVLPRELNGDYVLDHKQWIEKCLNSQTESVHELCDLASSKSCLLNSNGSSQNGSILTLGCRNMNMNINLGNNSQHSNGGSNSNGGLNGSDDEEPSSNNSERGIDVAAEISSTKNVPQHQHVEKQVSNKNKPEMITVPPLPLPSPLGNEIDLMSHNNCAYSNGDHEEEEENESYGISLEEFIQHLKDKGKKGLYDDYNEIKSRRPEGTFESSRQRANQSKNRYTDVLCYDHSRVKLSIIDDDPFSDYINANFVDGYRQKNAFISTQGPLPKTFNDFWRCVWEYNCAVIVMTTRTVERCRTKCGQYWPLEEESKSEYGPYHVCNNAVEQFPDWIITSLVISDSRTGVTREITHMQFTSWPDYGVPHSAIAMLEFRNKVREFQARSVESMGSTWKGHELGPPIIVHCSAGIGRTGTFITLDVSIQRLETTGRIDIRRTVEKIRSQRAYSIQMPEQYLHCFMALLEYALCRGLLQDVDLSGFEEEEDSELEE